MSTGDVFYDAVGLVSVDASVQALRVVYTILIGQIAHIGSEVKTKRMAVNFLTNGLS